MIELELLGAHADGSQLVFTDPDGQRFIVPIDDALRAAVRREGIRLETMPAQGAQLSPREIQQLLRAGMEPAEIASTYDVDPARVNRFLSPIRAEKNYIISQALAAAVGADSSSPTLGDLVVDRLATRGVDAQTLSWGASRQDENPWELHLTFVQSARQHHASWQVDNSGKIARALNDEARWLTETTTPSAPTHAVTPLPTAETDTPLEKPVTGEDVERILDELSAARGRRQSLDEIESDSEREPTSPVLPFPSGAPADDSGEDDSDSSDSDAEVLPGMDSYQPQVPETDTKKTTRKRGRQSVPSWDEIVFGSKSD